MRTDPRLARWCGIRSTPKPNNWLTFITSIIKPIVLLALRTLLPTGYRVLPVPATHRHRQYPEHGPLEHQIFRVQQVMIGYTTRPDQQNE